MLWDQEKKTPSYARVIFWVLAVHGIFITLLYFKNSERDSYLKPKLVVKNFVEKKIEVKEQSVAPATAVVENVSNKVVENKSKEANSAGLWNEKREEFFKEKLEAFSKIQKAKELALKKEKERAASLVKSDQLLKEQSNKSPSLNKHTRVKKTSPQILKKSSVGLKTKSGKKRNLQNEALQKKKVAQITRLKESLDKLEASQNQKNNQSQTLVSTLVVPELKKGSWTASLTSADASENLFLTPSDETEFRELFFSYLKEQLQLPAKGEVKLKITLSASGKVTEIEVLMAKSQVNEEYLKEELAPLSFPFFKNYLKNEKSFIITFLNEEE